MGIRNLFPFILNAVDDGSHDIRREAISHAPGVRRNPRRAAARRAKARRKAARRSRRKNR